MRYIGKVKMLGGTRESRLTLLLWGMDIPASHSTPPLHPLPPHWHDAPQWCSQQVWGWGRAHGPGRWAAGSGNPGHQLWSLCSKCGQCQSRHWYLQHCSGCHNNSFFWNWLKGELYSVYSTELQSVSKNVSVWSGSLQSWDHFYGTTSLGHIFTWWETPVCQEI